MIIQVVLSWRKKIPNNSWKHYFSEKMAFLWIEGKGMSNIWSTFPLITLICLKSRGKPLGKVYWPSQWQKSFQFILNPLHGPPPSLPDIGPMISRPWIENQAAEDAWRTPLSLALFFFAPCLQRWCKGKDLKIFQKQGEFQRASEWLFFEGLPSLRKTSQNWESDMGSFQRWSDSPAWLAQVLPDLGPEGLATVETPLSMQTGTGGDWSPQ